MLKKKERDGREVGSPKKRMKVYGRTKSEKRNRREQDRQEKREDREKSKIE